jgi:hypothetical protein
MKVRWVGPPNPGPDGQEAGHDVTVAGREFGNVKPGDVVDVPDELAAQVVFPPTLWEPVKAAKAVKKDGDA